jgi:hypothetical protein
MRELARVEGRGRFARVYYKNGAIESICLACFATVKPQGSQTLEDTERLHDEVCAKILKRSDSSIDLMADDSTMMRRDKSEWDFYNHPEDRLVLSLLLEEDDDADLKAYLRDHSIFEQVSERGMAFDHAPDPHAVVETLRHSQVVIKVAHEANPVHGRPFEGVSTTKPRTLTIKILQLARTIDHCQLRQ